MSKSPRFFLLSTLAKIAKIRSSFEVIQSRAESENFSYSISHIETRQEFWHLISGFKTRPRKILQSLALWRDQDLLSSFLNFETRMRIENKTIPTIMWIVAFDKSDIFPKKLLLISAWNFQGGRNCAKAQKHSPKRWDSDKNCIH